MCIFTNSKNTRFIMDYLGLANGNSEEKLIVFGDGACFGPEKSGAEKSQERTEKK